MDEQKKDGVGVLKMKVGSGLKEVGDGQSGIRKKFKNIETLDGSQCHKTIREILKQEFVDADADVVIEHKGVESVNDLIDLMFEIPIRNSEVEKFKEVANSSSDPADGCVVIENVVIPSATGTVTISQQDPEVSYSSVICEQDVVQDLVTKLMDVEGFGTESWGPTVKTAATSFFPSETFTEEEKAQTLSQFLQDDEDDNEEVSGTDGSASDDSSLRRCDTLENSSTEESINQHEEIVELQSAESAQNSSDSCELNPTITRTRFPCDMLETPILPSPELDLYNDGYRYAVGDVSNQPNQNITSAYVLDMVLAEAPKYLDPPAPTNIEQSKSEFENAEVEGSGSELYPGEESIQPLGSRVDEQVETETTIVERVPVVENSSNGSKAVGGDVIANENSFAASNRSYLMTCAIVLERVEHMLNPNPSKMSNLKKNNQSVDVDELNRQVKEWLPAYLKKMQQKEQNDNETSAEHSTAEPQSQASTSPPTNWKLESVKQKENEPGKNDEESISETIDLTSSPNSDLNDCSRNEMDSTAIINIETKSNSNLDVKQKPDARITRLSSRKNVRKKERSEDEEVCKPKQLIQKMKKEMQMEKTPNLHTLSQWMHLTFNNRKTMLNRPFIEVVDVVKEYPALKCYQIVKEEYGRILNDVYKMAKLEDKLVNEFENVSNIKKKTFGKENWLWSKCKQKWKDCDPNCDPQIKKILGMMCLSFHLAENAVVTTLCKLLQENEKPKIGEMATPTLNVCETHIFELNTEMWIYVDNIKYLKVPNFYEGVLCIYAIYWIFNLKYPPKLKLLLEFFDAVIGNDQSSYKGDIARLF